MNWLSAITAVSKLFGALTGLTVAGGCVGQGPKKLACPPSRRNGQVPNGWWKSLPIWILLITMNLISACANINAPPDGCGWVQPIIVAEDDTLTTATKRALLAHNEA